MQKILFFFSFVLLFSCNNEDAGEKDLLQQPPYKPLSDSISREPQNAGLYYRRGTLLYSQEEKKLAESDLKKAWELAPTEEHGLSLTTVLKEKDQSAAISFLEEATKKLPESIALKIGLARGYQNKGDREKALGILEEIIRQFPGQLDALSLKSEILGEMNKPDESLATLEKAQALVPSDPALSYDLAYEYAMAKNSRVLKLTDSLIKTNTPEIEKAFYSRGLYFKATGNNSEALKNFDAAIKSNYNFMDAYLDKGELYFIQKKYDDAQKTFELALKVAPANAIFYFWLAKCQEARGFNTEAKANYLRAYGLDKTLAEAKTAAERL